MLKTVSSITNAIGALNFKGTWNASTNTPTIVSGVGVKGDYFVVSVAGSTTIDGISNWGVGDWITYNGTVWQRVEGGADLNGVNLSVSGTTTLSGLTASTALALNASKEVVSVTNTGTGDNVLATAPTLVGDVTLSTGNLVVADTKGIDFSATPGTGTSELFDDYEEGTWTPTLTTTGTNFTSVTYDTGNTRGTYTKIGDTVLFRGILLTTAVTVGAASGTVQISGLPFTSQSVSERPAVALSEQGQFGGWTTTPISGSVASGATSFLFNKLATLGGAQAFLAPGDVAAGNFVMFSGQYKVA